MRIKNTELRCENGDITKVKTDVIVNAASVSGTFAELNTVYVTNKANFAELGNEAVTITDTVSAAQANTIANATTGVVTADVAAATAASLNAALKNAVATDALTLTVNGATATAADLNALDAKTKEVITVEATKIEGTLANRIRHRYNIQNVRQRMERIVSEFEFVSMQTIINDFKSRITK